MMGSDTWGDVPDHLPDGEPDSLLTRAEASAYLASLGITMRPQTLASLGSRGIVGPPFVKVGRRALYQKRALHAWATARLVGYRAAVHRGR